MTRIFISPSKDTTYLQKIVEILSINKAIDILIC